MIDRRKKNVNWTPAEADGSVRTWDRVQVALLMDIRDELQKLNRVLECPNFLEIPAILRRVSRHVARIPKRGAA